MDSVEIKSGNSPLILSMPHTGTYVPPKIWENLNQTGRELADTDWHVHTLYDGLAPDASVVRATFHRYVIDANRDPSGTSLYPGQNTTGLCPTIDFNDNSLYLAGKEPDDEEIKQRRQDFHAPYHAAIRSEILKAISRHGFAILYDCHSIKSEVPYLFQGKLPDFNIGTFDGHSCDKNIEQSVIQSCAAAPEFTHVLNGRFKGGWTTRFYGDPENGVHAIQMELAQSTYMVENAPWTYRNDKAKKIRPVISKILRRLQS